jgi:propane monooxygenase coupling protein
MGLEGGPALNNDVGITLVAGDEADAVVEVLTAELGSGLRVQRQPAYVRLETDLGRLEVRFADVGEVLGRPFTLHDFHVVFSTYYGHPVVSDDSIAICPELAVD